MRRRQTPWNKIQENLLTNIGFLGERVALLVMQ